MSGGRSGPPGQIGRLRHHLAPLRRAVLGRLSTGDIPMLVADAERRELRRRRAFGGRDLELLDGGLREAEGVVSMAQLAALAEPPPAFVGMRHDTDHDIETSVAFARWERARGYTSTFYVLHTDWYYRRPRQERLSRFVLRALETIAGLGHEIGLHNNAVAAALLTSDDPARILDRELGALRDRGFTITGTAAHGDPVCRSAEFVNSEMFTECIRPDRDPNRLITHSDAAGTRSVRLDPRPMADFGLTYEANYVPRPLYLSDVGGRWQRPPEDVWGRFRSGEGPLHLLIHPCWWTLA